MCSLCARGTSVDSRRLGVPRSPRPLPRIFVGDPRPRHAPLARPVVVEHVEVAVSVIVRDLAAEERARPRAGRLRRVRRRQVVRGRRVAAAALVPAAKTPPGAGRPRGAGPADPRGESVLDPIAKSRGRAGGTLRRRDDAGPGSIRTAVSPTGRRPERTSARPPRVARTRSPTRSGRKPPRIARKNVGSQPSPFASRATWREDPNVEVPFSFARAFPSTRPEENSAGVPARRGAGRHASHRVVGDALASVATGATVSGGTDDRTRSRSMNLRRSRPVVVGVLERYSPRCSRARKGTCSIPTSGDRAADRRAFDRLVRGPPLQQDPRLVGDVLRAPRVRRIS